MKTHRILKRIVAKPKAYTTANTGQKNIISTWKEKVSTNARMIVDVGRPRWASTRFDFWSSSSRVRSLLWGGPGNCRGGHCCGRGGDGVRDADGLQVHQEEKLGRLQRCGQNADTRVLLPNVQLSQSHFNQRGNYFYTRTMRVLSSVKIIIQIWCIVKDQPNQNIKYLKALQHSLAA